MKMLKIIPSRRTVRAYILTKYPLVVGVSILLLSSSAFAYHTISKSESQRSPASVSVEQVNDEFVQGDSVPESTDNASSVDNQPNNVSEQPLSKPSQSITTPTPTSKAGCNSYSDVPYKTVYQSDPSMPEGQTRTIRGINGSRKECTDSQGNVISNEVTFPPTDKTVYQGTYTREQALEDSRYECDKQIPAGSRESTFYDDCLKREMRKRGY